MAILTYDDLDRCIDSEGQCNGDSKVYRVVFVHHIDQGDRVLPKPSSLRFDPDLSLKWSKYADASDALFFHGVTKHAKHDRFKDWKDFSVFESSVSTLASIEDINDVSHSPRCNAIPSPAGAPNDLAHTSGNPSKLEEEDILGLQLRVSQCFDMSDVNLDEVESRVIEYRERKPL